MSLIGTTTGTLANTITGTVAGAVVGKALSALAGAVGSDQPRPAYRLTLDGTDISSAFNNRLESLTLTDNRGFEADTLDITLEDSDGRLAIPARGVKLALWLGWQGQALIDKGTFIVDEVEHSGAPDKLSIRARSADLRTGLTERKERSWNGQTIGNIVKSIAAQYDLTPMVADRLKDEVIEHMDQTSESDVNLLTRLAEDFDAIATVKKGMLLFMNIGEAQSATGIAFPPCKLTRQSGDQHRFSLAERDMYTSVRAFYQDIKAALKGEVTWDGKAFEAAAEADGETRKKRYTSIKTFAASARQTKRYIEIVTNDSGSKATTRLGNIHTLTAEKKSTATQKVLATVYARQASAIKAGKAEWKTLKEKQEKADTARNAQITHDVDPLRPSADSVKVLRHTYASRLNAEHAAKAEWNRLQRSGATLSITAAMAHPELFPELPVVVQGFKPEIDGAEWIITRCTHSLSDSGFTTAFEFERKPKLSTG